MDDISLAFAPAPAASRSRAWLQSGGAVRIASVLATLGAWELYGRGVDPIFLSYPTAILAA